MTQLQYAQEVLPLAQPYQLSAYDASYNWLAAEQKFPQLPWMKNWPLPRSRT